MFVYTMIDLQNLKFYYDKQEVDEYIEKNHLCIEDALQCLIERVFRLLWMIINRYDPLHVFLSLISK